MRAKVSQSGIENEFVVFSSVDLEKDSFDEAEEAEDDEV